jgi:uncharacterized protein
MAPQLVRSSVTLPLGEGGTGRIAVIADTHSRPHPQAVDRLAELRPDVILHAGDIGDPAVLDAFAAVAPLHAVRGNIDNRAPGLPDVLTLELSGGGRTLRMILTHIAVYGPKIRADVAKIARAAEASLIVCGHSHVPFIGRDRGLVVFNPGSIGPRRFHLPIVFGTIDVTPDGVRLEHIDCETGTVWSPPGVP